MEQQLNAYLKELLTNIRPYILSNEEKKKFQHDKIGFIVDKLERKDFRRFSTDKTRENLKIKILKFVIENKPIHFTIPFGGYKHFWNTSYPEPDWAEIFNFKFLTDYLQPILAVYKPGAIIEYISEDLIIPRMNNYTPESTKQYWDVFIKLMDWYSQFIPKNLKLTGFRIGDRFDKSVIITDVEKVVSERVIAFQLLSEEEKAENLKRSCRSIKWDGLKDLNNLSETEKMNKIIESRIVELAYYETEAKSQFLGNYLWDNITLFFTCGVSQDNIFEDLTIKSNYGSVVDYWIGKGILEYRDGQFIPKTVSKNQYQELQNIKLIKIDPPLIPFNNFKSIEIIDHIEDIHGMV